MRSVDLDLTIPKLGEIRVNRIGNFVIITGVHHPDRTCMWVRYAKYSTKGYTQLTNQKSIVAAEGIDAFNKEYRLATGAEVNQFKFYAKVFGWDLESGRI